MSYPKRCANNKKVFWRTNKTQIAREIHDVNYEKFVFNNPVSLIFFFNRLRWTLPFCQPFNK